MLVTSGPAEGRTVRIDGHELTLWFPTADVPPVPRADGGAVIVGRQRVALRKGNLMLEPRRAEDALNHPPGYPP